MGSVTWETALPSRLEIRLRTTSNSDWRRRNGAFIDSVNIPGLSIRSDCTWNINAVERAELERMCLELRIPGDFDVAQISWRPDYDPFFYRQLSRRACRIYLFRHEYIFDVEKAVVVETPQLGHATYVFAKPRSMDGFLAL